MQVKYSLTIFFLFGLLLICVNLAQAQTWQSLNGPTESDVRDVVIKNDTVYVAALGGFFKKATNSTQWHYLSDLHFGTLSIAVSTNGNYYSGGGGIIDVDDQVYQQFSWSQNYGYSWSEVRKGIEYCPGVEDIFLTADEQVLIGCFQGIFKLNKGENKFEKKSESAQTHAFFQVHDTLLAGTAKGILFSLNEGENWNPIGTDTLEVFAISYSEEEYYIGTNKGLYRAENLNHTWTLVNNFPQTPVNTLLSFQDTLFAGTNSGVISISLENSEINKPFSLLENLQVNVLSSDNSIVYVGTNSGLYVCTISENNCSLNGVPNSRIENLTIQNKDTLLASAINKTHRYIISKQSWDTSTVPIQAGGMIPLGSDSLYAFNSPFFSICSFATQECESELVDKIGYPLIGMAQTSDYLFIASNRKVFRSVDKGKSWRVIHENPDRNNRNIFTFSDSLLFISSASGLIKYQLHTNDYQDATFRESGFRDFYMTKEGTIYASAYYYILKSTNFGQSWTQLLHKKYVEDSIIDIEYDESQNILYGITYTGKIFVTDNEGISWGIHNEMNPTSIRDVTIGSDGTLYLGTSRSGVYANTKPLNPPITISNEEESNSSIPKHFTLKQNYPNPFNPSTTIPFELNQAAEVSISLYNVFGQKVREYDLGLKTTGAHQHHIELNHQASGVYFLRVIAGEHSKTIKISLIK